MLRLNSVEFLGDLSLRAFAEKMFLSNGSNLAIHANPKLMQLILTSSFSYNFIGINPGANLAGHKLKGEDLDYSFTNDYYFVEFWSKIYFLIDIWVEGVKR